jgi:YfiH family protein
MTGSKPGWRLEVLDGIALLRCESLLELPGVAHAFSTRLADNAVEFDLGRPGPLDAVVEARRKRFCDAAGLVGQAPVILRQQHGARIVGIAEAPCDGQPRADGVLALREEGPRSAAAVRTADCVPVLLVDEDCRAVAAVHAGWRGTALGIVARAVQVLGMLGIPPERLRAALGPSAGPCCYEVGAEVVGAIAGGMGLAPELLSRRWENGNRTIDLARANSLQLAEAGLRERFISTAPWCTVCDAELFFSHRREGAAAGRQMACIGWGNASTGPSP